jgi:hypothetical protein
MSGKVEERSPLEATLRMLASAPEPEGLRERVHARLAVAAKARRRWWQGWDEVTWQSLSWPARVGAVTALGLLLAAGLSVYPVRVSQTGEAGSHVSAAHGEPAPIAPAAGAVGSAANSSGFQTSGAVRVPPTLTPLHVPAAPKKRIKRAAGVAKTAAAPVADASKP